MKKLKQSQYYGIGLLVLMLVVFWAVFKVLAPTTFGSPAETGHLHEISINLRSWRMRPLLYLRNGTFRYERWCQYRTFIHYRLQCK